MLLSIIIPVYNGAKTIKRCLESIFNQNVDYSKFEVIVVDDCSTDDTLKVIDSLRITPPDYNLLITSTKTNSRQGTARNIGVKAARGKFISYLDADDFLVENSLSQLFPVLEGHDCDLVMYDSRMTSDDGGTLIDSLHYSNNPREILTGEQYLTKAEVPWVPWLTAFKRDFLLKNNIRFAEKVRFEDTDYVLKSVLLAASVIYRPIDVVCHTINPESTVHIGNDVQKISERFMTSERLYDIIQTYRDSHLAGTDAIRGHYDYRHNALLMTTLWRLKYNDILDILAKYPYRGDVKTGLLGLSKRNPRGYALLSQMIRPLLIGGIAVRNVLTKYKRNAHGA